METPKPEKSENTTEQAVPTVPQIRIDEDMARNNKQAAGYFLLNLLKIVFEYSKVRIHFPFVPYKQQQEYMKSVVDSCNNSKNALLESPTGTGKTLSLLCASLGWLHGERKKNQENYPRIIYLSRTHSQLTQAIKELKKTVYRPVVSAIGSRDMLCINPSLKDVKGSMLNLTCKKLRQMNGCPYAFNKVFKYPELKTRIFDIEDMQNFGQNSSMCPFYASRDLAPVADIIFMPYNYLLDMKIRSNFKHIQFNNSVIIFDEAHNVQKVAEDASCFEVSVTELKKCLEEIKQIQKISQSIKLGEDLYNDIKDEVGVMSDEDLSFLEIPVVNFIDYLCNVANVGTEGAIFEGKELFNIFMNGTRSPKDSITENNELGINLPEDCNGITPANHFRYISIAKACTEILSTKNAGMHLESWMRIIETVYTLMTQGIIDDKKENPKNSLINSINDYKVVICEEEDREEEFNKFKKGKLAFRTSSEMHRKQFDARCLKVFCFNPGLAFLDLINASPRSIILTSGTLSPMDSLEKELRIPFPIKLECSHVIKEDQAFIQVMTKDQNGALFNFNYQNRGNLKQRTNLGKLVEDICCVTPGGVLVFFSSYSMLNQCWDAWQEITIPTIHKKAGKFVYREEKTQVQNQKTLDRFKKSIDNGDGAVLFAVCRGKISEGIDFADDAARAVLVIGVPFPCMTDKRVQLKQEYLDKHYSEIGINGKAWYTQEAIKAVNQSIGRVIRHINDYGAMILIDNRYSADWLKKYLSKWLRDRVKITDKTENCITSLETFYENMKKKCFPQRVVPTENSEENEECKTVVLQEKKQQIVMNSKKGKKQAKIKAYNNDSYKKTVTNTVTVTEFTLNVKETRITSQEQIDDKKENCEEENKKNEIPKPQYQPTGIKSNLMKRRERPGKEINPPKIKSKDIEDLQENNVPNKIKEPPIINTPIQTEKISKPIEKTKEKPSEKIITKPFERTSQKILEKPLENVKLEENKKKVQHNIEAVTAAAASVTSNTDKQQWMKDLYLSLTKAIGKDAVRILIGKIQEYKVKKANFSIPNLAQDIHSLFIVNSQGKDDATIIQRNDALRKTSYFISDKTHKKEYEAFLENLISRGNSTGN